jgi:prepilin-type N-terminal cleavage/methylation domain-containing protein
MLKSFFKRLKSIKKEQEGFSFIELMIVIIIIATLSTIVYFGASKWIDKSRRSATFASLQAFKKAVISYNLTNGSFPTSIEQLKSELSSNANLKDAWGSNFIMARINKDSKVFIKIFSTGADKKPNTADDISIEIVTDEGSSSGSSSSEGSNQEE